MTHDWNYFDISFYYPTEIERVFRAWATPTGLKSFFIDQIEVASPGGVSKKDGELIGPGDGYSWKWRHGYTISGKFIEIIENEKVAFTFGSMQVAVSFRTVSGATLLQLRQSDIPTEEEERAKSHLNCRLCWVFFLTNLKSVLKTGTDLRDETPSRASSFEVGFRPPELNNPLVFAR